MRGAEWRRTVVVELGPFTEEELQREVARQVRIVPRRFRVNSTDYFLIEVQYTSNPGKWHWRANVGCSGKVK